MDLTDELRALAAAVGGATAPVVAVGSRTQFEVGDPVAPGCVAVAAPRGIVAFEPADLTVTVGAGTTCAELDAVLAAAGQEVALDPRDPGATVGGVLAVGTSGSRRLRHGPVRDALLEVRFATADGRVVKGGGPTVKNVSGYDLPRLLVGSFGTLGILGQVTLRARARPAIVQWGSRRGGPDDRIAALARPSSVFWDGRTTTVLLEGHAGDVDDDLRAGGLEPVAGPPPFPSGPHRGRISVRPRAVTTLATSLGAIDCTWLAEVGVGTVHVATDDPAALAAARTAAHAAGGWLLREAGAPELPGFGIELPNAGVVRELRARFDPEGKLAPGRMPVVPLAGSAASTGSAR
jgi:glycolate oxidase FAD binding subunit